MPLLKDLSDIQGFYPEKILEVANRAGLHSINDVWQMIKPFFGLTATVIVNVDESNAWSTYRLISALEIFSYLQASYSSFSFVDETTGGLVTITRTESERDYLELLLYFAVRLYELEAKFPQQLSHLKF